MEIALAVLGIILVSLGAGLIALPAGAIVAGILCIAAAYVTAYTKARAGK